MSKKNKKRLSANAKWGIALLLEVVIVVVMGIGYGLFYIDSKYDKVQILELPKDNESLAINEGANEAQKGYTTIALFGIDARNNTQMGAGNRSDSIMIASINNDTKEVRIVSIYRDTLLNVDYDGGITTKITHAYAYGGPELAIKTLNANLDLEISEFVTVNFMALTKAIDELGGVEISIEENELKALNNYIAEQVNVTGIYSDGVFSTGVQTLNGTQATAYARIRYTDRGDITRTERQREVLGEMIKKAKKSDVATINRIIDDVFPYVYTSITKDEMLDLAKNLLSYELTENTGFPFEYTAVSHPTKGSILVAADLETNVSKLHEFLFDTPGYVPTAAVSKISAQIINETGVYAPQQ
ncbi:MAG: LCP family protein [Wujia sp.]